MRIYDGRKSFFQWDVNQKLTSPNLSVGDEVHFHTPTFPSALVVKAYALGDLVVACKFCRGNQIVHKKYCIFRVYDV